MDKIKGDLKTLKKSIRLELEQLFDYKADKDELIPDGMAERLAEITSATNREVSVFINRKGMVIDVSIGDHSTVKLPDIDERRGTTRFSGIRCIHTHPNGSGHPSPIDLSSLHSMRLDCMISIGVHDSRVKDLYVSLIDPEPRQNNKADPDEFNFLNNSIIHGPIRLTHTNKSKMDHIMSDIQYNEARFKRNQDRSIEDNVERAILVGLETNITAGNKLTIQYKAYLDELEELAKTAGAIVVHKIIQKRPAPDTAYFIGRGKVTEIAQLRQSIGATLIIFDDELSGAQIRNIEELTGIKVIDRTTLILDIFAQRAKSSEGKLQVELAQYKYRLSRLVGMGMALSRLGGGIGTRGPGESKLESDRRHIRNRINILETQLKNVDKRRNITRTNRSKNDTVSVALVGYTNTGKSTLLNKLCSSDVFAENKLFATLDPTTRKIHIADGMNITLTDTVGFIRKLPHELVEAFKSTLDEAVYADIIIHVADLSSFEMLEQIKVVDDLLNKLGADHNKPYILSLNKADLLEKDEEILPLPSEYTKDNVVEISALTGQGLDELKQKIENAVMILAGQTKNSIL